MRFSTTLPISVSSALLLSGVLGSFVPPSVRAQGSKTAATDAAEASAAKKEPWKPEDVIYAESAAPQTRISPDAKWLVWVKSDRRQETKTCVCPI